MCVHRTTIAVSLCSLLACTEPTGTVDDLRVDFRITPAAVQAGDSMRARLVIVNPTRDTISLHSGSSCVATLDALKDGNRLDMEGTAFGCLTVVMTFPIPPRDSLTRTFNLVARLREDKSPWRYIVPPPPGVYRLRAAMQVQLPDAHVQFEVRQ